MRLFTFLLTIITLALSCMAFGQTIVRTHAESNVTSLLATSVLTIILCVGAKALSQASVSRRKNCSAPRIIRGKKSDTVKSGIIEC